LQEVYIMYSVVLMMALSGGAEAPDFHHGRCHGCDGGCHGYVGYACNGGCHGYVGYACNGGCHGYVGYACNGGCHGRHRHGHRNHCHGGGYCNGGYGGCYGAVLVVP
jgi:hypothetical protein